MGVVINGSGGPVNVIKIGSTDVDVDIGIADTGTQRIVVATDDPNLTAIKTSVQVIDDTVYTTDVGFVTKGIAILGTLLDGTPTTIRVTGAGHLVTQIEPTEGVDIGDVTVNNGAGAQAVNVQDGGNSLTVDAIDLDIRALTSSDIVTVTGGIAQVDPVKVTLEGDDVIHVIIDSGAAVTLASQTNPFTTSISVMATDLDIRALDSVTDSVTEANSSSIKTAVELIDDTVATIASAIPTKGIVMAGTDGTNARVIKTSTTGRIQSDAIVTSQRTSHASIFNTDLPGVDTDLLGADIADTSMATLPGFLTIYVTMAVTGILKVKRTRSSTSVYEKLNKAVTLDADCAFVFTIAIMSGDSINLQYSATGGKITSLFIVETGGAV